MMSVKKTDCPLLQKGVKRARKTVTLKTKMLVVIKIEDGEKRANVCSSLVIAASNVPTIMANAEKIKQSAHIPTKLRA